MRNALKAVMTMLVLVVMIGSLCLPVAADTGEKHPSVALSLADAPPVIDGILDDACWEDAFLVEGLRNVDDPAMPPDDTWAKISYNDDFIFLAFSCPHPYPQMMKIEDDGFEYKVHYDENVELAIAPDPLSRRLLKVFVNPRGVIQVVTYNKFGNAKWDYSDFCHAAAMITTNGWNLEVAVPWFRIYDQEKFKTDTLALNLARTLMHNKLDQYGVHVGYDTCKKSLKLAKPQYTLSKSDYDLTPVFFKDAPPSSGIPFAVAITQARVTDYVYQDGKCYYGVSLKLETTLPDSTDKQKFLLYIEDTLDPLTEEEPILSVGQNEAVGSELASLVECRVFKQRDLKLRVADEHGTTLAERVMPEPAIFDSLSVRLDRNYYTSEKLLQVVYDCDLPTDLAEKAEFRVLFENAPAEVTRQVGLRRRGAVPVDITALPDGITKARVTGLIAEQEVFEKSFEVVKRPLSSTIEVKLDHERHILLVNDEPFFPFGVLMKAALEEDLPMLAAHGVNLISTWFHAERTTNSIPAEGYQNNMDLHLEFIQKAAQHNIYVLANLDNLGTSVAGLPSLKRFFPEELQAEIARQAETMSLGTLKGRFAAGNSPWRSLPRSAKNKIFEEHYYKCLPYYRLAITKLSHHPNVIGYNYYDEPTLPAFDMNVQGKQLHNLIKELDGYRPGWVLYSSYIPTGTAAVDWMDCLGTDPYWVPPVSNPTGIDRKSINFVSRITANNKRRADAAGCVCWSIPMLENWSGTYKRLPTPAEFRCQSYLALIHGAKGLVYFVYPVGTEQTMQSFQRMGQEVKRLTPWLLARDLPQTPTTINAPVQYAIRANAADEHIALVANARPWPVSFTLELPQILSDDKNEITEFFDGTTIKTEQNAFTDHLPAFAVKVYALGKAPEYNAEISVDLKIAELKDGWEPEEICPREGRVDRRNVLPNPSFEEASVTGIPDYYFCGRKDPYPAWGSVDSPWTLDDQTAYHGHKSLRIRVDKIMPERNLFYLAQFIAPQHSTPTKYMFSVYMKAAAEETPVSITYAGSQRAAFKVGKEWKRYQCSVIVKANASNYAFWVLRPTEENTTVWIDAVQMELGETVTDFEE